MNIDNYECDGQMTISDWMHDRAFEESYPIPTLSKRWLDEEGWIDTWHYADKETPPEDDYYYTVWLQEMRKGEESYNYQYALFSDGEWYVWNCTTKMWQPKFPWMKFIIGWVRMPLKYQQDQNFIQRIGADIDRVKYKEHWRW